MLFVPFSILLLWTFQKELLDESENIRFGKTVWEATKVVAIFSFMIEFTQLLFHLGTFQISDLTYILYNVLELAFQRFTGFYTVHGPSPLKKSTYQKLWELEPELLSDVCSHPFRHREDVSQYVLREYQKLSGEFVPENVQKICGYYDAEQTNDRLVRSILRQKKKIICINDSNHEIDFEKVKKEINQAFEQVFSEKSSFENSI